MANRFVRQYPSIVPYFNNSDNDYSSVYPDLTSQFVCDAISIPEGEFVDAYPELYEDYEGKRAAISYSFRVSEWEKVINKGDMRPY